jgi:hypothetical protein
VVAATERNQKQERNPDTDSGDLEASINTDLSETDESQKPNERQ